MRNKFFRLVIVAALMSVAVCGCQKAPESSSNGDILHAKGSVENEVEAIVNSAFISPVRKVEQERRKILLRKSTVRSAQKIMP